MSSDVKAPVKIKSRIVGYSMVDPTAVEVPKGVDEKAFFLGLDVKDAVSRLRDLMSQAKDHLGEAELEKVLRSVSDIVQMNERLARPESLLGTTYKLKSPMMDHAMYVTINDVVLNRGTDHEVRRPFEIFINSKSMEQYQWVVALTLLMSAVFRKGGDVAFLVDGLRSVFDPRGGYLKAGGKFVPSLIAEIGDILERHLIDCGLMEKPGLSPEQKAMVDAKRAQFSAKSRSGDGISSDPDADGDGSGGYPPNATVCAQCSVKSVIIMDGCATCLNCGDSKCG